MTRPLDELNKKLLSLPRKERADKVNKHNYFTKYGELARKVIDALLDKYTIDGALDLEDPEIIRLDPLSKLGSPVEIIRAFGGKPAYESAIRALTEELYKLANDFLFSQLLGDPQYQVSGGNTFAQAAGELETHHVRR